VLVVVFAQEGVLRNPNEGLCEQMPLIPLRDLITSLYKGTCISSQDRKKERDQSLNPTFYVSRVSLYVCVLLGKERPSTTPRVSTIDVRKGNKSNNP
jgi:hypothetical protein